MHRIDLVLQHDEPLGRFPCSSLNHALLHDFPVNQEASNHGTAPVADASHHKAKLPSKNKAPNNQNNNHTNNNNNNDQNNNNDNNTKKNFNNIKNKNVLFEFEASERELHKSLRDFCSFSIVHKLFYVAFIYRPVCRSFPTLNLFVFSLFFSLFFSSF